MVVYFPDKSSCSSPEINFFRHGRNLIFRCERFLVHNNIVNVPWLSCDSQRAIHVPDGGWTVDGAMDHGP